MKANIKILARLLLLAFLYFICFSAVSAALLSPPSEEPARAQVSGTITALLAVSFLNTAVLAYVAFALAGQGGNFFSQSSSFFTA